MADSAQDSDATYIDVVKWIAGISSALLAGVFLHPEMTAAWTLGSRIWLAVVVLLLGISIYGGVVYLLWINRGRRLKEKIADIEKEQSAPVAIPDPVRMEKLKKAKDELVAEKENTARILRGRWYWVFIGTFFLGAVLGMILFCVQIALGKMSAGESKKDCKVVCCGGESAKAAPVEQPRFTVVQSAVHRTQHGMQAHTFLLDQRTGAIWQMICDQKGTIVAFQRVKRVDLNGNLEKDETAKPQ